MSMKCTSHNISLYDAWILLDKEGHSSSCSKCGNNMPESMISMEGTPSLNEPAALFGDLDGSSLLLHRLPSSGSRSGPLTPAVRCGQVHLLPPVAGWSGVPAAILGWRALLGFPLLLFGKCSRRFVRDDLSSGQWPAWRSQNCHLSAGSSCWWDRNASIAIVDPEKLMIDLGT